MIEGVPIELVVAVRCSMVIFLSSSESPGVTRPGSMGFRAFLPSNASNGLVSRTLLVAFKKGASVQDDACGPAGLRARSSYSSPILLLAPGGALRGPRGRPRRAGDFGVCFELEVCHWQSRS